MLSVKPVPAKAGVGLNSNFSKSIGVRSGTFLVDDRFGWIRTESELNAVINELEEEKFQDERQ